MWHDSILVDVTNVYVAWRIHMWHVSFICDMIHSYVPWLTRTWTYSLTRDNTHSYVTWHIRRWHDSCICAITHPYVTWLFHGWHDLTDYRALLRGKPNKDNAPYGSSSQNTLTHAHSIVRCVAVRCSVLQCDTHHPLTWLIIPSSEISWSTKISGLTGAWK